MRYFAEETNCVMLGEGIETTAELETLQRLGVVLGQGYLLGRPGPAADRIDGAPRPTRRSSSPVEASSARGA
jgi:EAL domain-containing protein (putative c-di-GMP-specific phosphodiesterase class I)